VCVRPGILRGVKMKGETENEVIDRPDSIKVGRTSTGKYSFEIKRYFDYAIDEPELVIKGMKKIMDNLSETFR
jgi:hypothetical protein